jgi:hypothetical protein
MTRSRAVSWDPFGADLWTALPLFQSRHDEPCFAGLTKPFKESSLSYWRATAPSMN